MNTMRTARCRSRNMRRLRWNGIAVSYDGLEIEFSTPAGKGKTRVHSSAPQLIAIRSDRTMFYETEHNAFILENGKIAYAVYLNEAGDLENVWFGKALSDACNGLPLRGT